MALRNLLVALNIDITGGKRLADADNAIVRMLGSAQALGTALRSLGALMAAGYLAKGLVNFVSSTLEAADALFNQAAKLGLTTDQLQAYQYAAAQFGITQNETSVAIRFFNRMIGEAQLGTKGAVKTMGQLGISMTDLKDPTMTTGKMLAIFSDKLEKMPNQFKRTAFVMKTLGRGGSSMLPILQQGSKKIKEVFGDIEEMGGGFDQAFAQSSHELLIQLKKVRMGFRTIAASIVNEMMPALKWGTELLMKGTKALVFIALHTYGFRTALIALASTLGVLAAALGVWLLMMYPILAPLALFVGLITALYLAFDDFYTFLVGGDSVLGEFLNKLMGTEGARKFKKDLVDAFHAVSDALGITGKDGTSMLKSFADGFAASIPTIIDWGTTFLSYVVEGIDMAISGIRILLNSLGAVAESIGWLFDIGSGKTLGKIWGDAGDGNDAITGGLSDRMDALANLRETLDDMKNPNRVGKGEKAAKRKAWQNEHGTGTRQHGEGGDIDSMDGAGLPPPPAPPPAPPLQVHVKTSFYNVPPGVTGTTKVEVDGQNRNTFDSVNMGMPLAVPT